VAETVQIGKAARLAGISVDAIRFYQKLGLVKGASRTAGRISLIQRTADSRPQVCSACSGVGFSLTEIGELLALRQKHHACSDVQTMLKHKLADVGEKIKSLARLEAELTGALRNCNRELRLKREIKHEDCCPLLTKLDRINDSNGDKYVSDRRKPGEK
jgi:DNA-binding transcriptional MerR regulator